MLVAGWARGGYAAQSPSPQTLFTVENLSLSLQLGAIDLYAQAGGLGDGEHPVEKFKRLRQEVVLRTWRLHAASNSGRQSVSGMGGAVRAAGTSLAVFGETSRPLASPPDNPVKDKG